MKEAIGNAALFYIIITFVVIMIMFFVGSLSYSKAFKVKNKIVEEIEKEGEVPGADPYTAYARAEDAIYEWLQSGGENGTGIGYRQNTGGLNNHLSVMKVMLLIKVEITNIVSTKSIHVQKGVKEDAVFITVLQPTCSSIFQL